MAAKDDIVADLFEIDVLRRSLLAAQAIVDGDVKSSMRNLTARLPDFGVMDEAVGERRTGAHAGAPGFAQHYANACAALDGNRQTLSALLGDLAKAARLIHDNYQHAAKNDTISAKSVSSALTGVEADFKPTR